MKRIFQLLTLLLLVNIGLGHAQSKMSEAQKEEAKANLEAYMSALDLNADQEEKYAEITKRYGEQMKALKNSSDSKWKKYKALKEIRKNKDAEMKALLNKDQYKVYEKRQEETKAKLKEQRKKG